MLCKADNSGSKYSRFTVQMAINLAAPHTWPAAIMPVLVATTLAAANSDTVSATMSLVCLVIVILMQSAVNTFNDYYDFVKGTDDNESNLDESDAVLVFNNVNPRSALRLAIGLLCSAFALGLYVILKAGFIPLAIALVGALFVVSYSAGKTPISYLPLGEFVSGSVMGCLIPLAVYYSLTLKLDWFVLLYSVPTMILIGLIMMTNNTCDIERDIEAGRKTLPVLLGRSKSVKTYHALAIISITAIVLVIGFRFTQGLLIIPFMILAAYPSTKALFSNPLVQATRQAAMPQILSANITYGAFYAAAILLSAANTMIVL